MPAAHVTKGSRVYLPSMKMFGEVIKTSALGTVAIVVQCDDGVLRVVCGDAVENDVVDIATSKNGEGSTVTIPTDVKTIGPQVLESIGVDEETRAALFQKFMVLDEAVRLEKAAYWEANKDNPQAMATFLPELVSLLGEDTQFIQAKSAKLLRHVDPDVRDVMLTNMMTTTSPEERKAMILQYTAIQNDKRKVMTFLQGMYERLLDDKTYIEVEFKLALSRKRVNLEQSASVVTAFVAKLSEAEMAAIVSEWRQKKYYRSRHGEKHALSLIEEYS
ncbi:unnamed protein product [Sphacelaria rigidula]